MWCYNYGRNIQVSRVAVIPITVFSPEPYEVLLAKLTSDIVDIVRE